MPRYEYIAIAGNGRKVKGTINAETPFAARKQLRTRNMHPSSITEVTSAEESKRVLFASLHRTSKAQLIDFTKQLATLLNSGIKLTEALSVLTMQTSDQRFKTALTEIRDRVVTGESFTDALKDYDDYFDVIFVAMVRVGEVTGTLGECLKTIADFMEKRQRVEAKVLTAMIYPIVLVFFCLAAILILTTKVIPPIGKQILQAGQELPWITQQMMNFSHILTSWRVFVLIAAIVLIVVAAKRFFRTERGAYLRDRFLLSLPVFGPLIRESGVIDPAIAHMVAVGEKSGELEIMLKNISENLEGSTDIVIERLSAAVEPLIIVIMAAVIGLIAYATILPILRISAVEL